MNNNGYPKIQINFNVRESGGRVLETSTLVNLRGENLDDCVSLFQSLKNKLCNGLEDSKTPSDNINLQFLNENHRECPECGGDMILRTSKNGKHPGSRFFGCSRFPVCGATLPA